MEINLTKWEAAKQAIVLCKTIDEIKEIRDKAEALRLYVKQSGEALEMQNNIAEIKIRAERRGGELLKDMDKQHGGIKNGMGLQGATSLPPLLSDIGIEKTQSHRWQKMADIPEPEFEKYIINTKNKNEELTSIGTLKYANDLFNKPHVSYNSGENEWYTPSYIIESVIKVMGKIDLDPASSEIANRTIKANKYYSCDDNGLEQTWHGNVWLNPPYSQPLVSYFSDKVIKELPNISQMCILVNNATDTNWLQNMMNLCNAVCFIKGRIKFIDVSGTASGAPLQGQVILYFGNNSDSFSYEFKKHGICMVMV